MQPKSGDLLAAALRPALREQVACPWEEDECQGEAHFRQGSTEPPTKNHQESAYANQDVCGMAAKTTPGVFRQALLGACSRGAYSGLVRHKINLRIRHVEIQRPCGHSRRDLRLSRSVRRSAEHQNSSLRRQKRKTESAPGMPSDEGPGEAWLGLFGVIGEFWRTIWANQLGPDQVPVIRAQVLASDLPFGYTLYGWAVLGWNRTKPCLPLLDHGGSNPQPPGKFRLCIERLAGPFDGLICIHAITLALLQQLFKRC